MQLRYASQRLFHVPSVIKVHFVLLKYVCLIFLIHLVHSLCAPFKLRGYTKHFTKKC